MNLHSQEFMSVVTRKGKHENKSFELEMPYYDKNEISDLELALVWQYVDKLNRDKKLSTCQTALQFSLWQLSWTRCKEEQLRLT